MLQQLNRLNALLDMQQPLPSRLGLCKTMFAQSAVFGYTSHDAAIADLPEKYDKVFVKSFGLAIANGDYTPANIANLSPKAAKFCTSALPNVSAMYGPKIKAQYADVLAELKSNPNTRRAYINVLAAEDKRLWHMPECAELEYACCIGLALFINNGKLDIVVNMRSSNIYLLPIDLCNSIAVQQLVANGLSIELGSQYFLFNNLHKYEANK